MFLRFFSKAGNLLLKFKSIRTCLIRFTVFTLYNKQFFITKCFTQHVGCSVGTNYFRQLYEATHAFTKLLNTAHKYCDKTLRI